MQKVLRFIYIVLGIACIGYYFVIGLASRFGLSMSWMWLLGGAVLIGAGLVSGFKRLPRWLRYAWRGMLCAGVVLVIGLESLVISGMVSAAPKDLDYLVVLGARVDPDGPSPALQRRLNAAMAYLEDKPETMVIASGGQGADEPMSEAQCIRDELVKRGIDADRILMEDQSTTTAENIDFSMGLIGDASSSVGVVTNNYHVYRAVGIAKAAGLEDAHGIAAEYTGYTLFHYMIREAACIAVDFLRGNL